MSPYLDTSTFRDRKLDDTSQTRGTPPVSGVNAYGYSTPVVCVCVCVCVCVHEDVHTQDGWDGRLMTTHTQSVQCVLTVDCFIVTVIQVGGLWVQLPFTDIWNGSEMG